MNLVAPLRFTRRQMLVAFLLSSLLCGILFALKEWTR